MRCGELHLGTGLRNARFVADKTQALAIAAKKRSPLLPDVPTSYEQGLPQFDCAPFFAVFAPKGTPKPVIDKLAAALRGYELPRVLCMAPIDACAELLSLPSISGALRCMVEDDPPPPTASGALE